MRFESPATVKDAVALLAKEKGKAFILAGGTDLLVKMKAGMIEPDLVIDIKRIKGMGDIKKSASGFVIGAGTPCVAITEDKALMKAWPGVVEAASLIGSKQVQGRSTMSGNLCNASPAADSVPALVAAGAQWQAQSGRGRCPLGRGSHQPEEG
jgi:aerobic carbon-monoxide dehydrogenase medium subunit